MKKIYLCSLLAAQASIASAQVNEISQLGCATVTSQTELQEVYDFSANPVYRKTTAGVDTIPLAIHIVGNNNGGGYQRLDNIFTVLCQLNERFAPVNFYFYIKWPIHYINNSSYYEHDYSGGYQMMGQNNEPDAANIYFVNDPAGACGYYSPGAGAIAIKNACALPKSTTVTHELGHFFGLPHTFLGWENGNTPSNPELVTRAAGNNCSSSGDGFCDTEADYLSDRWNCPYTGIKLDANGNKYHPDSSIYMSYSTDACMTRFSNMQIARMQNRLVTNYNYLLQNANPPAYSDLDYPTLLYPTDSIYSNYKTIRWTRVKGAELYHVKILQKTSSIIKQEVLTADTSLTLNLSMAQDNKYSISISPLSAVNLCRNKTTLREYTYTENTTTLHIPQTTGTTGNINIYPNPTTDRTISLDFNELPEGNYQILVTSYDGKKILSTTLSHNRASSTKQLALPEIPTGLYFLQVTSDQGKWTNKLLIQHQ